MAGIQRVVINQPGLRPGQPGAQITVPLSTLQVLNLKYPFSTLHNWWILNMDMGLILSCTGTSGWSRNSYWSAWSSLGQDRNWPISGEQIPCRLWEWVGPRINIRSLSKIDRILLRYYELVHLVLEAQLLPHLSQCSPRHNRYKSPLLIK